MSRGRPRKFDEARVLTAAMQVFWLKGLAATSLDDLSEAMEMGRPSLYNAFGNKEAIYRRALAMFCGQLDSGLTATLDADTDLTSGLEAFFEQALDVYCQGDVGMGCLAICTAPTEALSHPGVGSDLGELIGRLDNKLSQRLLKAQSAGELPAHLNPMLTARLLQATLHTLALRARAGESRTSLSRLARYAIQTLTL
jgi:AcrR family transcriptional regulator